MLDLHYYVWRRVPESLCPALVGSSVLFEITLARHTSNTFFLLLLSLLHCAWDPRSSRLLSGLPMGFPFDWKQTVTITSHPVLEEYEIERTHRDRLLLVFIKDETVRQQNHPQLKPVFLDLFAGFRDLSEVKFAFHHDDSDLHDIYHHTVDISYWYFFLLMKCAGGSTRGSRGSHRLATRVVVKSKFLLNYKQQFPRDVNTTASESRHCNIRLEFIFLQIILSVAILLLLGRAERKSQTG